MNSGVGGICCNVVDNAVVTFPTENISFSLDSAFDQDAKQDKVYEAAGKAAIEDVLNGYNSILGSGLPSGIRSSVFGGWPVGRQSSRRWPSQQRTLTNMSSSSHTTAKSSASGIIQYPLKCFGSGTNEASLFRNSTYGRNCVE